MNADWKPSTDVPDYVTRCLAVEDNLGHCTWHFAECIEGQWFDLSSGREIEPTHWMPMPPTPTGGEVTEYGISNGIGNAPEFL